ncbi:hypothetical protein PRUPE_6G079900 [Prunus persica]|uniref:IMS import disulfide relay-system CHCH-CHCH-like Cx9C domain-containing protein n=2 Tax=Prunus persica TaxID=3760 RepID=A0A251NLQ6_PRUPE|nr:hypothetical protein PRUPE_6G079900 [Prunus persica]
MPSPIIRVQSCLRRAWQSPQNHRHKNIENFEGTASPRVALSVFSSISFWLKPPIRYCLNQRMGRKAGTVYLNPKKFGALHKPCMKDMLAFLNCLALNHNNDDKCARQKELLGTCMDSQSNKNRKSMGSINYHLQRLSRGRK